VTGQFFTRQFSEESNLATVLVFQTYPQRMIRNGDRDRKLLCTLNIRVVSPTTSEARSPTGRHSKILVPGIC